MNPILSMASFSLGYQHDPILSMVSFSLGYQHESYTVHPYFAPFHSATSFSIDAVIVLMSYGL